MLTRRLRRRLILVVALAVLVALLSVVYINYRSTHQFTLITGADTAQVLQAPTFLYSFSGTNAERMLQPVGVYCDDAGRVYVSDPGRHAVYIFNTAGQRIGKFQQGKLSIPLYIAKSPLNGNIYVTDRGARSIFIYTPDGKYLGVFDPHLPKDQLPKMKTTSVWEPVAITFAPDGSMIVTEILRGHRFLIFDPSGKFKVSVGDVGVVEYSTKQPELFSFPNSVKVFGSEIWVADSNNRRAQVFDMNGKFLRIEPISGLPRGIAALTKYPGRTAKTITRFAVVDALAQDVSIFDTTGKQLVNFGAPGVLDGQFSYPTDVSVDNGGRIFVTDTQNGRVEVWGWPEIVAPIPMPHTVAQWGWCLSPLLLLPLLLLLRKQELVTTPDFVYAMNAAGDVALMAGRRRRWVTWEDTFGEIEALRMSDGSRVVDAVHFEPAPHSDSDARALVDRYEVPYAAAAVVAMARKSKALCTEDTEVRRLAKTLEIDVVNRQEFLQRFAGKARGDDSAE